MPDRLRAGDREAVADARSTHGSRRADPPDPRDRPDLAAPLFTGGSPVTGYYLLRGTASGRETVLGRFACTTATCTWQDTAITGGRTAYYRVVAVNAANVPGLLSPEVTARGR